MKVLKAVIPAAGLGTRLLPATKSQPKEMLPVVDRPAIQYVVEEAVDARLDDILIITGRGKRTLEDHFDRSIELESVLLKKADDGTLDLVRQISDGADIFFIRQKEPKGLGHAVFCSRRHVADEPFAVLLGDDIFVPPVTAQLVDFYERHPGSAVLAIQEVAPERVSAYGIVSGRDIDEQVVAIDDLVEKPSIDMAPSNLACVGRYVLPPAIFEALARTQPDANGEIQLTDAIRLLSKEVPVYGFKFDGRRFDIGSRLAYLATNVELALSRPDIADDFRAFLRELLDKEPTP